MAQETSVEMVKASPKKSKVLTIINTSTKFTVIGVAIGTKPE